MSRRAPIAVAIALCGALLLPGTGSGHPGHQVAEISVGLVSFQPAEVTIATGDGIGWVFRGPDTNHTITADAGQSETFDSDPGVSEPSHAIDDSYYHDFFTAGSFTYHCRVHPQMRGTVNVIDPRPPSMETPEVRPREFCAGRGCPKPKLRISINEQATLAGAIQRRAVDDWEQVRPLDEKTVERGTQELKLPVKGLEPGRYRVEVTARDSFNLVSEPRRARFVVLPDRADRRLPGNH